MTITIDLVSSRGYSTTIFWEDEATGDSASIGSADTGNGIARTAIVVLSIQSNERTLIFRITLALTVVEKEGEDLRAAMNAPGQGEVAAAFDKLRTAIVLHASKHMTHEHWYSLFKEFSHQYRKGVQAGVEQTQQRMKIALGLK